MTADHTRLATMHRAKVAAGCCSAAIMLGRYKHAVQACTSSLLGSVSWGVDGCCASRCCVQVTGRVAQELGTLHDNLAAVPVSRAAFTTGAFGASMVWCEGWCFACRCVGGGVAVDECGQQWPCPQSCGVKVMQAARAVGVLENISDHHCQE
jgi:hypothetical protein